MPKRGEGRAGDSDAAGLRAALLKILVGSGHVTEEVAPTLSNEELAYIGTEYADALIGRRRQGFHALDDYRHGRKMTFDDDIPF